MPTPGAPGAWDWRGRCWLVIASSHGECLGFGCADDGNDRVMILCEDSFQRQRVLMFIRDGGRGWRGLLLMGTLGH